MSAAGHAGHPRVPMSVHAAPSTCDPPRARHAARGFTLLEVLVALVIVALGMSALLETLSQSAGNISALRDKTVAEWIAMNQLALARLSLNAPAIGLTQGDVQNCGNGNWHWQQRVSAVNAVPGLLSITVSVQRTGTASRQPGGSGSGATAAKAANGPGATGPLGPTVSLGPHRRARLGHDTHDRGMRQPQRPGRLARQRPRLAGQPGLAGQRQLPRCK